MPRQCDTGKHPYASWSDAVKVIRKMQRTDKLQGRTVHGQEPYRCQCGAFHLTSNSYTKKRAS